MLNIKAGPSFGLQDSTYSAAVVLDFGIAVTPDRRGYVVFSPQTEIGNNVALIVIPVGFQYDFALPVRHLYVYPRLVAGYAAFVGSGLATIHAGFVAPEAGIKYVFRQRWIFGFEPFSLPVIIRSAARVEYRLNAYVGVHF